MTPTKYLVAKYIPDLLRFEPRNIGVVVYSPDGIVARFLGENVDCPGNVDARTIPAFVTSAGAYQQWIRYWRDQISQPRDTQANADTILSSSKGNFVITEAGELLDEVSNNELHEAVNYLFTLLVESPTNNELPVLSLRQREPNVAASTVDHPPTELTK